MGGLNNVHLARHLRSIAWCSVMRTTPGGFECILLKMVPNKSLTLTRDFPSGRGAVPCLVRASIAAIYLAHVEFGQLEQAEESHLEFARMLCVVQKRFRFRMEPNY